MVAVVHSCMGVGGGTKSDSGNMMSDYSLYMVNSDDLENYWTNLLQTIAFNINNLFVKGWWITISKGREWYNYTTYKPRQWYNYGPYPWYIKTLLELHVTKNAETVN